MWPAASLPYESVSALSERTTTNPSAGTASAAYSSRSGISTSEDSGNAMRQSLRAIRTPKNHQMHARCVKPPANDPKCSVSETGSPEHARARRRARVREKRAGERARTPRTMKGGGGEGGRQTKASEQVAGEGERARKAHDATARPSPRARRAESARVAGNKGARGEMEAGEGREEETRGEGRSERGEETRGGGRGGARVGEG